MNESKFTFSKFILFVSVLIGSTFVIAYILYNLMSDNENEEAKIIVIEGEITSINNNLLSVNIKSISPELKSEINKALVVIDDSTEIISYLIQTDPDGDFIPPRTHLPPLDLINKEDLSIGYKVSTITNPDKIILSQRTNVLEVRADVIQVYE